MKYSRILFIFMSVFILTGCVNIRNSSIESIINTTINSNHNMYNHVNRGYKYYLPKELTSVKQDEFNEILKSKYYDYYLYVDLVAYHNKQEILFEKNEGYFYSGLLEAKSKKGIINVIDKNEEYLVKITYNYASIEVKCKKIDVNEVISNALIIVSSISYNDNLINSFIKENDYTSVEEQINIFEVDTKDRDTLDVDEEDMYTGNEEEDYDPDVIN